MASKIKVDTLETANGSGTIALSNQLSGMTTASLPALTGAQMPAGSVLQVKNVTLGTIVTTSAAIPFDNTIPQIGEGAEAFTLSITPISATSKLSIRAYSGCMGCSTNNRQVILSLFKDTTANALTCALGGFQAAGTAEMAVDLTHFMTAGTTNAITFRVRFGANDSGSASLNGNPADGQRFGGVAATGMTIMEIKG